jgi:glycosyltransferase involved in cell wall biosynthesis
MKNTEHFSKIHLSIVPSLCNESFGLVVVESLACNVPVIASMVGGIPEIIKENINGLFCFPESPNSLSECIMKFYSNPELLAQMSINARESVSEFLNVDEWIEKYEKILELVIGGKDAKTY